MEYLAVVGGCMGVLLAANGHLDLFVIVKAA